MAGTAGAPADEATSVSAGKRLYERECLSCHQADMGGVPFMQPSLLDSAIVKGDAETLIAFVMTGTSEGGSGQYGNVMQGYAWLSDEELAALLTYVVRTADPDTDLSSGAISADQVARVRKTLFPD